MGLVLPAARGPNVVASLVCNKGAQRAAEMLLLWGPIPPPQPQDWNEYKGVFVGLGEEAGAEALLAAGRNGGRKEWHAFGWTAPGWSYA